MWCWRQRRVTASSEKFLLDHQSSDLCQVARLLDPVDEIKMDSIIVVDVPARRRLQDPLQTENGTWWSLGTGRTGTPPEARGNRVPLSLCTVRFTRTPE